MVLLEGVVGVPWVIGGVVVEVIAGKRWKIFPIAIMIIMDAIITPKTIIIIFFIFYLTPIKY